VDTLRGVQEHVKLSEPTEEDYLSETDDDESTMAYKED
jgi:hypothetical protein